MDLNDIILKRDEKQKQLTVLLKNKATIDEEYGEIQLQIARLEVRKNELRNARTKAAGLIAIVRIEIESLKDSYFNTKAQ